MAGISKKQPHPYWQQLMDQIGCSNVAELARFLDLNDQTVRHYVYDGVVPPLPKAEPLAKKFGVPVVEFMQEINEHSINLRLEKTREYSRAI